MRSGPIRFLLVEDDDSHAMITTRSLKKHELVGTVDRVSDGEQAMAFLRAEGVYADRVLPDVILLDLKLPKVSGHEVLERVKSDPELHFIPIVVLTTSDAPNDRRQAYNLRANSYLVKPRDFETFKQLTGDVSYYWGLWNEPV